MKEKKAKKKNILFSVIFTLIFLAGLSLLLYPTVSDWWNSMHQSTAIAEYSQRVAELDDDTYAQLLADAQAYNETLVGRGDDRFVMTEAEQEEYEQLLTVSGTGIIGYVQIEKVDIYLPIYHGTNESALQVGTGHLEGSSVPVGGESTHSVISGHTGLPSSSLFTDIDQLEAGDTFVITVLGETLTYEVDQILTVEPTDLESLAIEEGMDYCTLMTCTPYGVNSHRLLVRGHRVPNAEITVVETFPSTPVDYLLIGALAALGVALLLVLIHVIRHGVRKKKNKKLKNEIKDIIDDL